MKKFYNVGASFNQFGRYLINTCVLFLGYNFLNDLYTIDWSPGLKLKEV